jgi:hypothetical protein
MAPQTESEVLSPHAYPIETCCFRQSHDPELVEPFDQASRAFVERLVLAEGGGQNGPTRHARTCALSRRECRPGHRCT